MNLYNILLDILKMTIAGVGVVWVAFYLIKPYLDKTQRLQVLELKKAADNTTLPLRLQAYERIVLLVERLSPASMLVRLNQAGYSAADLHLLAIQEVNNEYQHNITQQVYVSSRAWGVVRRLKNDTTTLLNNTYRSLPEGASGLDLARTVLAHLSQQENDPYEVAASMIRADLDELFG
ncbi:hypothetical protein LLH06_01925 [Mucilaginibacter daejeonensis]|uniref:DUF7935 family protein n=1 Tax=Mucilaginibacter daejeonensis TaxID=398049 RepID=UPI001D1777BC|nr:hypothetical protein [Mucilaginibacter daejeonensis]UEG53730.1 hypothetical protein LLH06_01925 [Mucilaginibacter daejeonensis]